MKKIYLMMFVFSAALTHISCGSGSGLRSANLTPAQQQRILDTLQTSIGSADSSANMDPSSTPTGSLSCDQGVENFSVSATSGSVTDVNCVNFEGSSYNATTDLVVNGNVSYQASSSQVVFTYNNVSARRDTRSCTLSGTMSMSAPQSATSSISLQMSLNSLCGATSIRESGNVTFSTSGGHDYANGIMTFDVGSGAYDCQLSNLDLNTVSCSLLAQACRFPTTLCGATVAADSSSGSGGNTDVPFSFSQSPGIGGGGSGGSYQFPNLINATQSQGTYCMTHEKLIGMWTESTSYNSPYIRFEPMRLFYANFGNGQTASGTYEVIASDRIRFVVDSGSLISLLPAGQTVEASINISTNTLQLTFSGAPVYTFMQSGSDSSFLENDYRRDEKCTLTDYALPSMTATTACAQEIFKGQWHYLFPTIESTSMDMVSFSSSTTSPLSFQWKYLQNPTDSYYVSGHQEQPVTLFGTLTTDTSHASFQFTRYDYSSLSSPVTQSFTYTSVPPYLSLRNADGNSIVLGRKYSTQYSELSQEDGICEGTRLVGCPAASLVGVWNLGSYFKTLRPAGDVYFSPTISVPIFDRIVFNGNGTLQIFRSGVGGETFYYQVRSGCYRCNNSQSWSLRIARDASALASTAYGSTNTAPLLDLIVSTNAFFLEFYADDYSSNLHKSEHLVFEKGTGSFVAPTTTPTCVTTP